MIDIIFSFEMLGSLFLAIKHYFISFQTIQWHGKEHSTELYLIIIKYDGWMNVKHIGFTSH